MAYIPTVVMWQSVADKKTKTTKNHKSQYNSRINLKITNKLV